VATLTIKQTVLSYCENATGSPVIEVIWKSWNLLMGHILVVIESAYHAMSSPAMSAGPHHQVAGAHSIRAFAQRRTTRLETETAARRWA
jgi:hypothetical protein